MTVANLTPAQLVRMRGLIERRDALLKARPCGRYTTWAILPTLIEQANDETISVDQFLDTLERHVAALEAMLPTEGTEP